jgi:hypothetical protein
MPGTLRRLWLPVVGACGLLLGCGHDRGEHYPSDPLLVSKKPITSRPPADRGLTLARREPPAPTDVDPGVHIADAAGSHSGPTIPASLRRDATNDQ